jgi:2-keto-4-pentenoate hydratase/2-oxohepta-3-ene-1,7-dioic acid hydratase in catechol pathway
VRFVAFDAEDRPTSIGALSGDGVVDLAELLPREGPQAMLEMLIDGFADLREPIEQLCATRAAHPLRSVRLRASVPAPGKVLCVMRNRAQGPDDAAPPYAYLKYADGAVGPGDTLPPAGAEPGLRYEPELAVVVRGPARDIAPAAWRDAVFGFTGFLDGVRPGSAFGAGEDWWKSWDTPFAVGPAIVTADEVADPGRDLALTITTPDGAELVRDPGRPALHRIIAFLSSVMTLRTGDLIACGAHQDAVAPAPPGARAQLDLPPSGQLAVEAAA